MKKILLLTLFINLSLSAYDCTCPTNLHPIFMRSTTDSKIYESNRYDVTQTCGQRVETKYETLTWTALDDESLTYSLSNSFYECHTEDFILDDGAPALLLEDGTYTADRTCEQVGHVTNEEDGTCTPLEKTCDDGAPCLLINDGAECICDRTCESVKYGTNLDGSCREPDCSIISPTGWVQVYDLSLCDNFDTSLFNGSNKRTGIYPCPDTCYLKSIDESSQTDSVYYEDFVNNNDVLNDYINVNEQSNKFEVTEDFGYSIIKFIGIDGNITDNDEVISDYIYHNQDNSLDENITNNYVPDVPSNYSPTIIIGGGTLSDAPEPSTGSGGNSLSDDLKNLGNSVNLNTYATNENTDALNNNSDQVSSLTDKIGSLIDIFTDINTSNIDYAQNGLISISDRYTNLDLGINDTNCPNIEPIGFTLSNGKSYQILNQEFLNTLPLDIFRMMIIFSFTLSGVVMALKTS